MPDRRECKRPFCCQTFPRNGFLSPEQNILNLTRINFITIPGPPGGRAGTTGKEPMAWFLSDRQCKLDAGQHHQPVPLSTHDHGELNGSSRLLPHRYSEAPELPLRAEATLLPVYDCLRQGIPVMQNPRQAGELPEQNRWNRTN